MMPRMDGIGLYRGIRAATSKVEACYIIKAQLERMADITRKLMRITRYETRDHIEGKNRGH